MVLAWSAQPQCPPKALQSFVSFVPRGQKGNQEEQQSITVNSARAEGAGLGDLLAHIQ